MRYFFNLTGSSGEPDVHGLELDSVSDARIVAVKILAETLRDKPELAWSDNGLHVEVTNQERLIQFTVAAFGINAPVTTGKT